MAISPRDIISKKSQDAFQAYKHNKSLNVNWVRGLTNLSAEAAQEYEDRFLIELIQNGYDAHPPAYQNGKICIRLVKDEGDFGTLYVGNTGNPFGESNFNAICDIAQSDKKPGKGIGNKGVGFRSVLHVCNLPEVFSAREDQIGTQSFGGFCFGFATSDDYRQLAGESSDLYRSALIDIAPQFLPVFRSEQNHTVKQFAKSGIATVIRLPIERESGVEVVQSQLDALLTSGQPVLLFLDRISELVIEVFEGKSQVSRTRLHRKSTPIQKLGTRDILEAVDLVVETDESNSSPKTSAGGRFVLLSRQVERHRLEESIAASIEGGFLDKKFAEWEGDALVSVAARLDEEVVDHCMYTFLPMPDAPSPFAGYVNAPFAPKLDRKSVNKKIPLNDTLLTVAAELCAESLPKLKGENLGVAHSVLVDFLCWNSADYPRLQAAFAAANGPIEKFPIVPIIETKDKSRWGSFDSIFDWPNAFHQLTSLNLASIAGIEVIDGKIGPNRIERLKNFLKEIGWDATPDSDRVAEWAETIADELARKPFNRDSWDAFYDDLARYFSVSGKPLEGKRLLIDSNGILRAAGPYRAIRATMDAPSVFFPPASGRAEEDEDVSNASEITIPESVSKFVCYLHADLKWRYLDGHRYRKTPARDFLQRSNLVLRYDTENLLEHLSKVAQQPVEDGLQGEILRLAFQLFRASNAKDSLQHRKLKFYVPTKKGFRTATEALFSGDWKGTRGTLLEGLIRETRGVSEDLRKLEERLILSPSSHPFAGDYEQEWERFLRAIGVKEGLWPGKIASKGVDILGYEISSDKIAERFHIGAESAAHWNKIRSLEGIRPSHPSASYRIEGNFSYLPGQEEHAVFSEKAKLIFASLIIKGLGIWSDKRFQVTLTRPHYPRRPDTFHLSSPLKGFIKVGKWLPIRESSGETKFVSVAEAWHFLEHESEEPPRFMPLIVRDLRDSISSSSNCRTRLSGEPGIKILGEPTNNTDLLLYMGKLVHQETLLDEHVSSFKKVYARTWDDVLKKVSVNGNPFEGGSTDKWIVVEQGGELKAVKVAAQPEHGEPQTIYVSDRDDKLAHHLLSDLRRPLVVADERNGAAIAALIQAVMGARIKLASEAELTLTVKGQQFSFKDDAPFLFGADLIWLKEFVPVLIDVKSRVHTHHTEKAQREVQARLEIARVVWTDRIEIQIEGVERELPPQFEGVLFLDHEQWPTLLVSSDKGEWDWGALVRAAKPIMELVDRGSLGDSLQAALLRLAQKGPPWQEPPNETTLAVALGTDIETLGNAKKSLRASLVAVFDRLYPVLVHWAGRELADKIEEDALSDSKEDGLPNLLQKFAKHFPIDGSILANEATAATSLPSLRDKLAIDYAEFNVTLALLLPRYRPFHNSEGHRNAFSFYKQKRRESVLASLRAHYRADFEAGRDLLKYVELKRMDSVLPSPDWLDKFDIPPEMEMKRHLDSWLLKSGVKALEDGEFEVGAVEKIRADNRKLAISFATDFRRIILAWCRKSHGDVPGAWTQADPIVGFVELLDGRGLFDFQILTKDVVFDFTLKTGHWPDQMPQVHSADALGLTPGDFATEEEVAKRERDERDRERRTIEIGGKRYSASGSESQALVDAIRQTLTPNFLKEAGKIARLDALGSEPKKGSRKGGSSGSRLPNEGMTDAQKTALGLAGEVVALEWLKRKFRHVDENCWKSSFRNSVYGGNIGDDSCGFDFEIPRKRGSLMFEVKASDGDASAIELGVTQVEAAQRYARSERYRILLVRNVLDPNLRTLHILPNPFGERGRDRFRAIGAGLKFAFRIID